MDEQLPDHSDYFGSEIWSEEVAYGKKLARRTGTKVDRDRMASGIVETFDMIGGVPRLAHWANDHPGYFYTKILPKVLPNVQDIKHGGTVNVVFHQAIPPSPLDGEITDASFTVSSTSDGERQLDSSNDRDEREPSPSPDYLPAISRPEGE